MSGASQGWSREREEPSQKSEQTHVGPEVGEHQQWPLCVAWSSHSVAARF